MECHLCKHREDVAAGRYAQVTFEETPCAKCKLKPEDFFAIDFNDELSELAQATSGQVEHGLVEDVHFPEELDAEVERRVPVSVLWDLVVTLLALPPRTRDVICWRYAGYRYRDIAQAQHVTTTAVELRHRRALKRYPLLRCLFPSKAEKQRKRKRHAVAGEEGES